METVNPELAIKYSFFEISISSLISGYFLGMSSCYMYKFYKEKYWLKLNMDQGFKSDI